MHSSRTLLQVRCAGSLLVLTAHSTGASARGWRSPLDSRDTSTDVPSSLSLVVAAHGGAIHNARRYQRTTSNRVRSSSWKAKAARYDRLQEEQDEAEAAAQRRARTASSAAPPATSFWRPKRRTTSASPAQTSSGSAEEGPDLSRSHDGGDPAAMPRQGVWSFLRGGKEGRFRAPLNPLHSLKKKTAEDDAKHNADARATQRLLHVVDELRMRSKKNKKESVTMQLSEEQRKDIVNRYVNTRWYGSMYRPFRDVTEKQIKWTRRLTIAAMLLLSVFIFGCCFYVYYEEMKTIMALSEKDREDYLYMVNGMRYSDIFFFAQDVLKKEDPLSALPPAARYHVVIEACRAKGWHTADWEVEQRKMHPNSPMVDMDLAHMFYWTCMLSGNMVTGGGAIFSTERMDEMFHVRARAKAHEMEGRFVEAGPEPAPENGRRGFFS